MKFIEYSNELETDKRYKFSHLYDLVMVALGYYCNSTELRFIEDKQQRILNQ
jgi:hypothetical protein